MEEMYSIILHNDNDWYYIAEIKTDGDIKRIEQEYRKLDEEYFSDDYEWDPDFYNELGNRTWLTIYEATILDL